VELESQWSIQEGVVHQMPCWMTTHQTNTRYSASTRVEQKKEEIIHRALLLTPLALHRHLSGAHYRVSGDDHLVVMMVDGDCFLSSIGLHYSDNHNRRGRLKKSNGPKTKLTNL